MAAVRVPPSACSTSQSMVMVTSPPMAFRSHTLRRLRPTRRSISMLRPLRPFVSRRVRLLPAAGSMAYSAVSQPLPEPLRQPGARSSMVAVHSTRVSPNSARQLPLAFFIMPRVSFTSRMARSSRSFALLASMASSYQAGRPAYIQKRPTQCRPSDYKRERSI